MYQVGYWYHDGLEWDEQVEELEVAMFSAKARSQMPFVSEALVYDEDGTIVGVWVDGEEKDVDEYIANDLCDDYDDCDNEIGYDPYSGCYDMDL